MYLQFNCTKDGYRTHIVTDNDRVVDFIKGEIPNYEQDGHDIMFYPEHEAAVDAVL